MDQIKILIVEDDPIIAADLEDRLGDMGYTVVGAYDKGEDAFVALNTLKPDLILMDVQLAGMWNGIETARQISSKYSFPIIYLTSNSDEGTFKQAKETKPAAFLSKPFRGRDLKHAIELAIVQSGQSTPVTERKMEEGHTVLLEDRLFLKNKDRLERYFFHDIIYIEADDYYCRVFTKNNSILLTQTLAKFSEKIDKQLYFFRTHRSYIVNLNYVEQIGEKFLTIGQTKIPISQTLRSALVQRINKI